MMKITKLIVCKNYEEQFINGLLLNEKRMSIEVLHGNCLEVMMICIQKMESSLILFLPIPHIFCQMGASHVKMVKWFMLTRVIGTRARVQI